MILRKLSYSNEIRRVAFVNSYRMDEPGERSLAFEPDGFV